MKFLYSAVVLLFLLTLATIGLADERGLVVKIKARERISLIIGNSNYASSPLKNPVHDAEDIAAVLTKRGFEVILKLDASKREMEEAIQLFGKKLSNGKVGLFFYAGHGMQVEGRNYLIPIDAVIEGESDVKYEGVDAGKGTGQDGRCLPKQPFCEKFSFR